VKPIGSGEQAIACGQQTSARPLAHIDRMDTVESVAR
jgi:hypothetical protein